MEFQIGKLVRLVDPLYLDKNNLLKGTLGTITSIGDHDGFYNRPTANVRLEASNRDFVIFKDTFEYVQPSNEPQTTLGQVSKAETSNPKDILGSKKVPLGQVCPVAMAHESCAMLDGDLKYGFRNWREKKVVARIYIDAALRHLQAWSEGEEYASDSGVHHLGHARACLGILLDAQATGNLIDNRSKGAYGKVADELSKWVTERTQKATKDSDGAKQVSKGRAA